MSVDPCEVCNKEFEADWEYDEHLAICKIEQIDQLKSELAQAKVKLEIALKNAEIYRTNWHEAEDELKKAKALIGGDDESKG